MDHIKSTLDAIQSDPRYFTT